MSIERVKAWQVQSPSIGPAKAAIIKESSNRLVHRVRSMIYGECPECHGTHIREVYGWDKVSCKNCGSTWKTGF